MVRSYYTILGLSQSATPVEIRKRFLELARERHPDRFQGAAKVSAEEEFQAISEAFNVLSDPERRRRHDNELARAAAPASQRGDKHQLVRVYLARGVESYRAKNYLAAAESFERATREDPENALAWHHLARAASHQRRWLSRATEAIARACELEPMNASYFELAGHLFAQAGRAEEAERYFRQALKWDPDSAAAHRGLDELGRAAKKKGSLLFGKTS